MIFWRVTKLIHRLSTCFLLFDFLLWKRGRMAKTLRCSFAAAVFFRRTGSNPVLHRRSLWTWMSSTEVQFEIQTETTFRAFSFHWFFFFMKHVFIQITQVWAHYFNLFNRVQSTQDEKARFIKGNEQKLSYFHSFFKRKYDIPHASTGILYPTRLLKLDFIDAWHLKYRKSRFFFFNIVLEQFSSTGWSLFLTHRSWIINLIIQTCKHSY